MKLKPGGTVAPASSIMATGVGNGSAVVGVVVAVAEAAGGLVGVSVGDCSVGGTAVSKATVSRVAVGFGLAVGGGSRVVVGGGTAVLTMGVAAGAASPQAAKTSEASNRIPKCLIRKISNLQSLI